MSNHVVAFIDILGQQEWLKKMTFIPTCEAEWDQMIPIMRQTKGAVDAFRHGFQESLQSFKDFKLPAREFDNPDRQKLYDAVGNCDLALHAFSDFLILHSSVHDTKINYPIIDVWHMLLMCSHMFIAMLCLGKPIRGGIALGPAFDGELYGNPYCVAYDVESAVAKWPRIVVHESLARFIWCQDGLDENDPRRPIILVFQNMCERLITRDIDGLLIVDYMGTGYRQTLSAQASGLKTFTTHLHQAYEFVVAEQTRYRNEENSKLAMYYHMLRNYMAARISDWPNN